MCICNPTKLKVWQKKIKNSDLIDYQFGADTILYLETKLIALKA